MLRYVLAAVAALCAATPCDARTWYILPDGSGDAPTIRAGVDSAAAGDSVLVACGEYTNEVITCQRPLTLLGEAAGCVVIGGDPDTRLTVADTHHVTIANLDIKQSNPSDTIHCTNVSSLTFRACRFTGVPDPPPTSESMVRISNGTSVLIDDCDVASTYSTFAAAIQFDSCTGVQLVASRLTGTIAGGGAVYLRASNEIEVRNCLFEENQGHPTFSIYHPAALGLFDVGGARVEDCVFSANSHWGCGGLYATTSTEIVVLGCEFADNHGYDAGAVLASSSIIEIRGTLFSQNQWGAVWNRGSIVQLNDCRFVGNVAPQGGALRCEAQTTVSACTFLSNRAFDQGGGAIYASAPVTVEGSLFVGNLATGFHRWGGAVRLVGDGHSISGCSFVANDTGAQYGSAIRVESGASPVPIDRTIFFGNVGTNVVHCIDATPPALSCVDQFGNLTSTGDSVDWAGCTADQSGTAGNFAADPLFCDADNGDLTIRPDSPCAPPGITGCGLVGALPVGCGPVSVEAISWGKLKGAYR